MDEDLTSALGLTSKRLGYRYDRSSDEQPEQDRPDDPWNIGKAIIMRTIMSRRCEPKPPAT
jgi:hypothetical protein